MKELIDFALKAHNLPLTCVVGLFMLSWLTSNSILSKLASKSQKDVYAAIAIAETGSHDGVDFEGNYTPAEIDEFTKISSISSA